MREVIKASAVLLAIAVLIVACSASVMDTKVINSYGVIGSIPWLRVEGKWIVDGNGNRVALRGGGGSYTAYDDWVMLEKFMQEIKSIGGNCYRLGFNPRWRSGDKWADKMTQYDPEKMDRTLNLCEKYGLYAILDCHHWQGTGDPNEWHLLPNYKDYWIQTWVEIAQRYKDRSVVAGYELCNEAWGYADMALECIDAIRQVDQRHIIFLIESANTVWDIYQHDLWGGRRTWNPDQIRPNCVYITHHWWGYPVASSPSSPTDYEMGYCASAMIAEGLKTLRDFYNAPVLLGEFGVYDYDMDNADAEHFRDLVRNLEDLGIGWWYWMMEKLREHGTNFASLLRASFGSPYYSSDIPRSFNPKPFNLLNHIVAHGRQEWSYNAWGVVYYQISGQDAWIKIKGPCTVRVREWQTAIWYGSFTADYLISIMENETQTISFGPRKEVFSYHAEI